METTPPQDALREIRDSWRTCKTAAEREGFRKAALPLLLLLERTAVEGSLWTAGVEEADLNATHCLGEHLSCTRRLIGFVP